MSSYPCCSSSFCQSRTFFPRTSFSTDSGKPSCRVLSCTSSCLAMILALSKFLGSDFVIFSNAHSSIGCVTPWALVTNWLGVCQVPTKISSFDLFIGSPSWYSPLSEEGISFWESVSLVLGGSQQTVANSGISWVRFLCFRCWTARLLILGLGGELNENFLATKKLRMAAATRFVNSSG